MDVLSLVPLGQVCFFNSLDELKILSHLEQLKGFPWPRLSLVSFGTFAAPCTSFEFWEFVSGVSWAVLGQSWALRFSSSSNSLLHLEQVSGFWDFPGISPKTKISCSWAPRKHRYCKNTVLLSSHFYALLATSAANFASREAVGTS